MVAGYFRQSLLQTLEVEVRKSLDQYKKLAEQAIGNAQSKVGNLSIAATFMLQNSCVVIDNL